MMHYTSTPLFNSHFDSILPEKSRFVGNHIAFLTCRSQYFLPNERIIVAIRSAREEVVRVHQQLVLRVRKRHFDVGNLDKNRLIRRIAASHSIHRTAQVVILVNPRGVNHQIGNVQNVRNAAHRVDVAENPDHLEEIQLVPIALQCGEVDARVLDHQLLVGLVAL